MSAASPLDIGDARRTAIPGGLEVTGARRPDLAALQAGEPEAPPVLLVPGFTGSKEDFGPLLDPLAAAGFRVTAIDLPGQYESPGPDDPAAYTPDALATAVLACIDVLGPAPVRLLGHSFGGLVARAAVIARPDVVDSLVLLGSGPAEIGPERRSLLELLEPVLDTSGVPGLYDAAAAVDEVEPDYIPPSAELAQFLRRRFLAGSAAMLRGMSLALRTETDRVAELAATGVRVLVAHGVDDVPWSPAVQRDMAQRLGAPYLVIDAAAHSPAVENPAATVSALLDFWLGAS